MKHITLEIINVIDLPAAPIFVTMSVAGGLVKSENAVAVANP
ncbi:MULTISPECIES: hypothetical protein [Micrococcaceae]|nr:MULTISPECIES: hypothetical protein [unclassified Arthrobacter]